MVRVWVAVPLVFIALLGVYLMAMFPRGAAADSGWFSFGGGGELVLACDTAAPDPLVLTLQKALPSMPELEIRAADARGTQAKLAALAEGQADIALVRTGLGMEYGKVGALAGAGTQVVHLVVPAASPLTTFRDLAGRRVGVGEERGDADLLARRVFAYLNYGEPPLVVNDHGRDLEAAFSSDEIDAAFLLEPLLSPVVDTLLASGYYRLLPVPEAAAIARVLSGVTATEIPASLYGPERRMPVATEGPFSALGVASVLVARPSAPVAEVTGLLSTIVSTTADESLGVIRFSPPPAEGFAGLPLHAAAEGYLRRSEPVTREDLRGFLYSLLGAALLLVAAHQGVQYLLRAVERRRRRGMVQWYELVQDIGARMEVADSPQELGRLVDEMASKQRLIERGWITGKIDTHDLLLLTQAHQVRVTDALAKQGRPVGAVVESGPVSHSYGQAYAGSFSPDPEPEPERSETIVRPDYGEALVNTVRVRRREPAPAEAAVSEPVVGKEEAPASRPVEAVEWAREQPSIIDSVPDWGSRRELRGAAEISQEREAAPAPVDAGEQHREKRTRRGRRGRGKGRRGVENAQPREAGGGGDEDDEQLDLFGRKLQ